MRKWNKKNKKQIHNYTHEIYVENTCTSCKMRSPMSQTLRSAYYYSPVIIILFPDKKTIILSGVYCIIRVVKMIVNQGMPRVITGIITGMGSLPVITAS